MRLILGIILLNWLNMGIAQSNYFQQEVNYVITGVLDDSLHTFTGDIEMEYTNNSPDALDFIYLHLWGQCF